MPLQEEGLAFNPKRLARAITKLGKQRVSPLIRIVHPPTREANVIRAIGDAPEQGTGVERVLQV
jgi:hypothetical protein